MSLTGNIINFIVKIIENIINFTDFFSVIIVILAAVSFYICHNKVSKNIKSLRYFIIHRDEVSGRDLTNLRQVKEKNLFNGNSYIENIWSRYINYARNNTVQSMVPDISSFFNRYNVIDEPGRRQIAQIVPGILTALGILGTFIGLQDGISKLTLDNPELIEESIKNLTDGMSLAFISSIVGIVMSMIWSYLDRSKYKTYVQYLDKFYLAFNEKFRVFTSEYYLNEIFELQRESTEAIKHLATDISLNLIELVDSSLIPGIESSMTQVINESIVPNINHINHAFENFANSSTDNQIATLNTMINNFNKQLNETVSISFNELENTIKEFTEWHKETKVSLESLIEKIKESSLNYSELNSNSEAIILKFNQLFDQISKINQELGSKMDTIKDTTIALQEISTSNAKTTAEVNRIQKKSIKSYAKVENSVQLLKEDLERTWHNLESITIALNESTSNFSNNLKDGLETTFNIFDDNLSEISSRLSSTILEIQDTVEELPSVMTIMYNELQSHTLQLSEALEEVNNLYNSIHKSIVAERKEVVS
ncbi:MotA/TolQ/ExbB proton channel family protein [Schnuerera ultunensis]|uniref:MotA/TolQ/ExbB proton channel family protein n=1 Tax=Schnuerera ultunensis TaxID=45497 RepID=UPI000414ADEE|nr:MotA/TolQ/ExbB proton channel family protein [Schnuerera ultunensis]